MKTYWENGSAYCQVTEYEVVVGSNPGGSGHTDNAGSCGHADFLKGKYQDLVRKDFGEDVLAEVIAAIKASSGDKEFEEKRDKDVAYWFAWEKIPLNPELEKLSKKVDDRGKDHYAKGPDHSTVLNLSTSATLTLPFESCQGTLILKDGTVVIIPERGGAVLEYKGFLYFADIHLTVYDFFGRRRFGTLDLEKSHGFGGDYRISDVLRSGNHILALYRNFFSPLFGEVKRVMGNYGYLEIDHVKGIISRCPIIDR